MCVFFQGSLIFYGSCDTIKKKNVGLIVMFQSFPLWTKSPYFFILIEQQ